MSLSSSLSSSLPPTPSMDNADAEFRLTTEPLLVSLVNDINDDTTPPTMTTKTTAATTTATTTTSSSSCSSSTATLTIGSNSDPFPDWQVQYNTKMNRNSRNMNHHYHHHHHHHRDMESTTTTTTTTAAAAATAQMKKKKKKNHDDNDDNNGDNNDDDNRNNITNQRKKVVRFVPQHYYQQPPPPTPPPPTNNTTTTAVITSSTSEGRMIPTKDTTGDSSISSSSNNSSCVSHNNNNNTTNHLRQRNTAAINNNSMMIMATTGRRLLDRNNNINDADHHHHHHHHPRSNSNSNSNSNSTRQSPYGTNTTTTPPPPPPPSRSSSSGNGVWNVQHRNHHPNNNNNNNNTEIQNYYNEQQQQQQHELNNEDDVNDDDDDDRTNHHHRRRRQRRYTYCYFNFTEFWNTWFYTLAYQRTIVLIFILFITYTSIIVWYAILYYTMSQLGQSLSHIDVTTTTTTTTTTSKEQQSNHRNWIYDITIDPYLSYRPFSHWNQNNDTPPPPTTTTTTTATAAHLEQKLLLYLFCDMDIHTPMEAMYFSLSTMASIGYGVSDYYFGNCCIPFLVVLFQICTAICYDAIAIGLLFQRLRRSHKRSKTILFTNTAIVQRINHIPYIMIRIAELRHNYPLVNATVSAYCIYHDRYPNGIVTTTTTTTTIATSTTTTSTANNEINNNIESTTATTTTNNNNNTSTPTSTGTNVCNNIHTTYYVTKPMKLQQQCNILMNIPQVIVHPIVMNESPLCPPPIWYDINGVQHSYCSSSPPQCPTTATAAAVPAADAATTTTTSVNDCSDINCNERKTETTASASSSWMEKDVEQLQLYIQDRNMEIIIVINGTDELTGTCTQTKQSYTYNDLQWNAQFVSCMYPASPLPSSTRTITMRDRNDGGCVVDFASFHSVEAAPFNSDYSPYI